MKKPAETKSYGLRMPLELMVKVEACAQANRRSVNSQIVFLLEGILANKPAVEVVVQ